MRCDFCSETDPALIIDYQAEDFTGAILTNGDDTLIMNSNGNWLACGECAVLIDNNEWNKLEERFLSGDPTTRSASPDERAFLRDVVRAYWLNFRFHRKTQK